MPETLLRAVLAAVPREDRTLDGQVFAGLDADALRTSLGRACETAGVPAFSPHDLRHRRASLWHLGGMPVAEACDTLGHSPQVHLGFSAMSCSIGARCRCPLGEVLREASAVTMA